MLKAIRIVWGVLSIIFMAFMLLILVLVAYHDPAKFFLALRNVVLGIGASLLILSFIFRQFKRR